MVKVIKDYFLQVALIAGTTATTTVLALVNKYWNWPTAVVYSTLLVAALWYLTEKIGLGISTRARVRNWLDESGFAIQTLQDTNEFHFVVTDKIGLKTSVIQSRKGSPLLIEASGLGPSDEQKAAFHRLEAARQAEFWKHIRLELMKYGIQFSDLTFDGGGISVSDQLIAGKALTGVEFLRRLLFVRTGARLYWEFLLDLVPTGPATPSPDRRQLAVVPEQSAQVTRPKLELK